MNDPNLWEDLGRLCIFTLGVMVFGTIYFTVLFPGQLTNWLNNLIPTLLTVSFALATGLFLYRYQTRETDRKKYKELSILLRAELSEIRNTIEEHRTEIDIRKFTALGNPLNFNARLKKHYPDPLIVQEAIKSGLFNADLIAKLQALSRLMHTHQLEVQYAVNSVPLVIEENAETARYGTAVQSVLNSEDRVIEACKEVMELVKSEGSEGKNGDSNAK